MTEKNNSRKEVGLRWLKYSEGIKSSDEKTLADLKKLSGELVSDKYKALKEALDKLPDECTLFRLIKNDGMQNLNEYKERLVLDIIMQIVQTDDYYVDSFNINSMFRRLNLEFKVNYNESPFVKYKIDIHDKEIENWEQIVFLAMEAIACGYESKEKRSEIREKYSEIIRHVSNDFLREADSIIGIKELLFGRNFLYQQYGIGIQTPDDAKFTWSLMKNRIKGLKIKTGIAKFWQEFLLKYDDVEWMVSEQEINYDEIRSEYIRQILEVVSDKNAVVDPEGKVIFLFMEEGLYVQADDKNVFFKDYCLSNISETEEGLIFEANESYVCHEEFIYSNESIEVFVRNPFKNKRLFIEVRRKLMSLNDFDIDENRLDDLMTKYAADEARKCYVIEKELSDKEDADVYAEKLLKKVNVLIPKEKTILVHVSEDEEEWMIIHKDEVLFRADNQLYYVSYDMIDEIEIIDDRIHIYTPESSFQNMTRLMLSKLNGVEQDREGIVINFKDGSFDADDIKKCLESVMRIV